MKHVKTRTEFLNEGKETDFSKMNFTYDEKRSLEYMEGTEHLRATGKEKFDISPDNVDMIAISVYIPKNIKYEDWRLFIRYMKNKDTIMTIVDDTDEEMYRQTWKNGTDKSVNLEIDDAFMNLTSKYRVA